MQKSIDRKEISEEMCWVWICPICGFKNTECENPELSCYCASCEFYFEIED